MVGLDSLGGGRAVRAGGGVGALDELAVDEGRAGGNQECHPRRGQSATRQPVLINDVTRSAVFTGQPTLNRCSRWAPGPCDVEPVFMASADSDRLMIRLPVKGEWLYAPIAVILDQFREIVLHRHMTRVAHFG